MKWADRAKKILESPRTRTDITDISGSSVAEAGKTRTDITDITDISGVKMTSVGSVGATCKAFSEKNGDAGAEVPFSLKPLPGHHFIDPIDHHYLPSAKTMKDLSECRGYPKACQRCRSLMTSGDCLLGPGGDDEQ